MELGKNIDELLNDIKYDSIRMPIQDTTSTSRLVWNSVIGSVRNLVWDSIHPNYVFLNYVKWILKT